MRPKMKGKSIFSKSGCDLYYPFTEVAKEGDQDSIKAISDVTNKQWSDLASARV
jgi:hypothetical protein